MIDLLMQEVCKYSRWWTTAKKDVSETLNHYLYTYHLLRHMYSTSDQNHKPKFVCFNNTGIQAKLAAFSWLHSMWCITGNVNYSGLGRG